MKKTLTVLFAAVLLIACIYTLSTQADAATSGYYTYTVSGGKAKITDCSASISGAIAIPATLGGYQVTAIDAYAFYECNLLTSVTIGDSVTTIGERAFFDCDSLTSINIGDSVKTIGHYAFFNCDLLTAVSIGDSVETIGNNAFYSCDSLTSITIPNSVTAIGGLAFASCVSLVSIWVENSNSHYSSDTFGVLFNRDKTTLIQTPGGISGSYTIPDSVKTIGHSAFDSCNLLTAVTIPDSVTTIDGFAFYRCGGLTSVTIPDSVVTIGIYAFYDCTSLTSITIPNSVTTIGDTAFCDCTSLTNVYYAGTQEQWKKIIGSNDGYMTNATIHYNHIHNYSLLPPFTEPATCTQAGYTEYTCAYGETYREVLPALPHDYTGGKKVIAPTCTEDGYTAEFCTRCNAIESKYNITPALGHKMVLAPAVAPTCAETGLTAGTCCERCQIVGVSQEIVPATGHSFADGICTVCGAPECSPGDLDGVEGVNEDDVIYLLQHLLMPEDFSVNQSVDYDKNNVVDEDDVIYLLQHLLMPEEFPLN